MPDISKVRLDEVEYFIKDKAFRDSVGNLNELVTSKKNNLVNAINEVATMDANHAVKYTSQDLDSDQMKQARDNIGVGSVVADTLIDLKLVTPLYEDDGGAISTADGTILVLGGDEPPFIKTINGVGPDEDGNINLNTTGTSGCVTSVNGMTGDVVIEGGSGGVSSWNDLTDKPFEVAAKIYEYNSNTTYDEVIVLSEEDSLELVKISDDVVESDMFIGGSIAIQATLDGEALTESMPITEDMIASIDGAYVISDGCIVVTAESVQYPFADIDLVIPRGVWITNLAKAPINNLTIEYIRFLSRFTPLPESVIPDTIARVEDITWERIPDKPFYNSYVEVIPEQNYRIYRDADNLDVVYNIISLSDAYFEKIEEGKTYAVNAFGSTVICVAQKIEHEWFTGIILGNPYWAGASADYDNGLDFAVMYRENDDGTVFKKIRVTNDPVTGTFGIHLIVPVCLDETFIPDTIARKSDIPEVNHPVTSVQPDWNQNDENAADYIKNRPNITVDSELSETSENPVQNKVVTEAINSINALVGGNSDGTFLNLGYDEDKRINFTDDLNDYVTPGVYSYVSANATVGTSKITNVPDTGINKNTGGFRLIVSELSSSSSADIDSLMQTIIFDTPDYSTLQIWTRVHSKYGYWSAWFKTATTSDVQAMINATSGGFSCSWNNLTDKPFYEETFEVELYRNDSLAFEEHEDQEGLYISQTVEGVAFEDGKTYRINWDGGEYVCDCILGMSDDESSVLIIGNLSLMSPEAPNSGEPFLIECIHDIEQNVYACAIGTTSTLSTHSVVISGETSVVTALDEKFIPDSIVRKSEVTWENLPDKPFGEESGGAVIEWDGNFDDKEIVMETEYAKMVKISELAPTNDELIGAKYVVDGNEFELNADTLVDIGGYYTISDTGFIIINNAPVIHGGVTIESNGCYHLSAGKVVTKLSYGGSVTVKQLDEKYIPDTIARTADIPTDDHINALIAAKLAETTLPSAEEASF